MCAYCGCEAISVIGRLMSEHEAVQNAAGELGRAAERGDADRVSACLSVLVELLDPHVAAEERGLFHELHDDPEFAPHIDRLCAEHVDMDVALSRVRGGDLSGVDALVRLLAAHIAREENGVFPAAATALDGPAWERIVDRLAQPAPQA